jgi:cytochrome c-type biogenesis protein CcmH/NrfF
MAGEVAAAAAGAVIARRVAAAILAAAVLAGAGAAAWRSMVRPAPDPVHQVAAGLRCPACQGESVADSRSPVAAAMREVIAAQLADGRSPEQIRDWFVQRYGSDALAAPPASGLGMLLWVVPCLVLAVGVVLAMRTLRRGPLRRMRATGVRRPASRPADRPAGPGRTGRLGRRAWDLAAVGLVGLIAAVALASPRPGAGQRPAVSDPVAAELALARSMEEQGQYAAAADIYRETVNRRPDDDVRLRLAFALIRSGQPADAQQVAGQVLAVRPDDPEALLMLGLAQREARSAEAAQTLRRFLALAPNHPAAAEVRRLLPGK